MQVQALGDNIIFSLFLIPSVLPTTKFMLFFPGNHLSHSLLSMPGLKICGSLLSLSSRCPSFSMFRDVQCVQFPVMLQWANHRTVQAEPFQLLIISCWWSLLQHTVQILPAAPPCRLRGLDTPSLMSVATNKNTDIHRRTSHGLWA